MLPEAMPPPNTPAPSQQPNHRKRPSERVVPAIPLALSKPRASKPKPKAEADARAGAEVTNQDAAATTEATDFKSIEEPSVNGASHVSTEHAAIPDLAPPDVAVRQSNDTPESRGSAPMSLSNGATPELPATDSMRPSTPPSQTPAPAPLSPASSRKPTDRFDMRHIRTELPPAFIPSAEQHTPRSAASSHSNRPPVFHSHAHPSHPSASSIVFGGQESSTSSPAPPHSAGSAFVPPPYNSFGSTQQPYFTQQGHAHHTSEPHGQRTFHPGYQQPNMHWNGRQGYAQQAQQAPCFQSHAHMPFRYPPRDVFTPGEVQQPNGRLSMSRSDSRSSSAAADQRKTTHNLQSPLSPDTPGDNNPTIFQEQKAAFPNQAVPRQAPYNSHMPPPPPPQFPHPDVSSNLENAEALRSYLQSHFSNPALADCCLQVVEQSDGSRQNIDGHKVILSRSPVLLTLLQDAQALTSGQSPLQVPISLKSPHMRTGTFTEAVRYLYGGPLLQLDHHRPGSSAGEHMPTNVERMENALSYIATGAWLKIPAVAARGVEVAGGLLHWDTISTALAFALDGGLALIWTVDDGSEDKASTSSSEDSSGRADATGTPTYEPYSTHLLQRIVDFTVHVLPPNFYLDASAPQLASCPRLPAIPPGHESRQSRSDPRLSRIRFGEIPVEDHQRPSFTTTTISSMLLSLPFSLLKCVLEHFDLATRLGPETVASIMRQVIAERETRRTKVLKARTAGQIDDDAQLAQNIYWEESVETSAQHRAGFRLARRRREIDTPPSSGACSERHK